MGGERRVGVCVTVEGEEAARESRGSPGWRRLGLLQRGGPGDGGDGIYSSEAGRVWSERRAAVWLSCPSRSLPISLGLASVA